MKAEQQRKERKTKKDKQTNKQRNNFFGGEDSVKAEKVKPANGLKRPRPNLFSLVMLETSTSTLKAVPPNGERRGRARCLCHASKNSITKGNGGGPPVDLQPRRDVNTPATRNRGNISGPAHGRTPAKGGGCVPQHLYGRRLLYK